MTCGAKECSEALGGFRGEQGHCRERADVQMFLVSVPCPVERSKGDFCSVLWVRPLI